MAEIRPPYTADLDSGIKRTYLNTIHATGDALANCYAVALYKGNTAYTLPSGATVKGYFVRQKDNSTIELSGTKSGNVASVTLNSACYNQSGPFTLTIKVLEGSAVTTVFYGEGSILTSRTGTTVNPSFEAVEYYKYPVNLLDNSNFLNPINQRGFVSNTRSNEYTIDRWKCESGDHIAGTVTLDSNGITLTPTAENYCGIIQNLERYSALDGKTCTVAVCVGGVWSIVAFTMGAISSAGLTLGNGLRVYSSSSVHLRIRNPEGNGAITVQKVALYEGAYTAETLPPYVPNPYAVELAECMRYYQEIMVIAGSGAYAAQRQMITLTVKMRIVPSVTYKLRSGVDFSNITMQNAKTLDVTGGTTYTHATVMLNAEL